MMKIAQLMSFAICFMLLLTPFALCQSDTKGAKTDGDQATKKSKKDTELEVATFGSGCFWCTEAIFQRLKGVEKVVSGYTGGKKENPTYKEVCTGETGHAEVIQVTYNPAVISFDELLEVFWKTHDPTTLNQQGYDIGTQYRSAVFYSTEDQRKLAEEYKGKLNKEVFDNKVTTEITALSKFYPAEDYHQNYFNSNKGDRYCRAVIAPKIEKFEKVFKDKKKDAK